mgnify:CR=1 FL=1
MKKLISMVMAAAMVVSLVPATAFADTGEAKATAKVIDALDVAKSGSKVITGKNVELQLKVNGDGQYVDGSTAKHELTFTLDGAEFTDYSSETAIKNNIRVTENKTTVEVGKYTVTEIEKDGFKLTINGVKFQDEDIIGIKLGENITLDSTAVGKKATISVEGDMVTADDLVFAQVKDTGIKATLKKVAEVAEDESTKLEKELKIESNVDDFAKGQVFELKLSNGFEFGTLAVKGGSDKTEWKLVKWDKDAEEYVVTTDAKEYKGETEAYIQVASQTPADTITVASDAIEIVVDSAKKGAECKLTVKAVRTDGNTFADTADAVVAAKVVDNDVTLSVDEDEDVPVIYSGVNTDNYGITDDSDHKSLEVTIKESAAGALDVKKAIDLDLPEGVYVTGVKITNDDNAYTTFVKNDGQKSQKIKDTDFKEAYKKGDEEGFEFARKTFVSTDTTGIDDKMELSFELTLIAEPNFEGDVVLKLSGDGFDKAQEVTIAKFVKPYTVEASQNDLIIDYRNTKVPTNVVVKEAEEGLWKKDEMNFKFGVDYMTFEDDATYTVDDKSGLEVKAEKGTKMGFKVTDESSDTAAAVTISDIALYMDRTIAAGAYDLDLFTTAGQKMLTQQLWTNSTDGEDGSKYSAADVIDMKFNDTKWEDKYYTQKEGFINVITAGRDQDDASFTKKVVVPVGEKYLIAGEEQVALDVPAYISAQGYTMLPVRAVATALGINNNNVLWNQATKTVTILYGQRIITMVAGQKVVTVNGNTIPASATVQIKDGRTFLPMRDLATALGVTDITWDAATKTATMNGSK